MQLLHLKVGEASSKIPNFVAWIYVCFESALVDSIR